MTGGPVERGPSDPANERPTATLADQPPPAPFGVLARTRRRLQRHHGHPPGADQGPRPGSGCAVHDPRGGPGRRGRDRGARPADGRVDQRLHGQPVRTTQALHLRRDDPGLRLPDRVGHLEHDPGRRGLHRLAAVLLEYGPGSVPGLRPGPRARPTGRSCQRARRPVPGPRGRDRRPGRHAGTGHRRFHHPDDRCSASSSS